MTHLDCKFGARRRGIRLALHLVSGVATCLIAVGCHSAQSADSADDAAGAKPTVTVQAAHPTLGAISEHVNSDAVLSPIAQSAISPKISAPVKRFYVQRGSHVKQGQLLATLENADLTAAALDNKGSYTAAQAAYESATRAQVPEDAQRAELDVTQAKANLDLNQSIVNSRQQLFAQGAIPGRDLDTATAALVQAQAAYDTATKHLALLQSVSREASLTVAKGQLASAEGKYLGANAQVAYSEIRSPISGIVTDRSLFAGETATAGVPLLTVMDVSSLLAKVHLAQSLAQRLVVGGDAEVIIPGMDEPLRAKISLISPALDPGSTTVEVWLRLANAQGTLKVGTPVHVRIGGRTVNRALLIPEAALVPGEGSASSGSSSGANTSSVVVIGDDGAAHKRAVTVGINDSGQVQVISGLSQRDTVVTVGAFTLEDGAKVRIGDPDAEDSGAGHESGDPATPDSDKPGSASTSARKSANSKADDSVPADKGAAAGKAASGKAISDKAAAGKADKP